MTSRERLLTALSRGVPDRLPVTTHHLMPTFLQALDALVLAFADEARSCSYRGQTPVPPSGV
jgi:hypothetical protein